MLKSRLEGFDAAAEGSPVTFQLIWGRGVWAPPPDAENNQFFGLSEFAAPACKARILLLFKFVKVGVHFKRFDLFLTSILEQRYVPTDGQMLDSFLKTTGGGFGFQES